MKVLAVSSRPASRRWMTIRRLELGFLLLPFLFGTISLVVAPALLSFALAFTDYDALSAPVWSGLKSFRLAAADPLLVIALKNSLYFAALAVPLRLLAAFALALLLNRPGFGPYRAAIFLPTVIPDAAYALVWLWIVNPLYGPLNLLLVALGLPAPAWLVNPATAKGVFVIMAVFQIGEGFAVLLAGLQTIPSDHYAAAAVDGASGWQAFRAITLPSVKPWLVLLAGRDLIMSFQSTFTPVYLMTGGDPYYATLFLPLHIYEEAFDRLRFGPGAAMMLLMFIVTLLLIVVLFRLARGWGYSDEV